QTTTEQADPAQAVAQADLAQAPAPTDPAQPPARAGLALETALRETLKLNPNISLQQQQVFANRGIELQALGQFDPLVSATLRRSRDLRPLRADEIRGIAPLSVLDPTFNVPTSQVSNATA